MSAGTTSCPTRCRTTCSGSARRQRLPFEVTHEIDSDYCVGLLDFATPDEYAALREERRRLRDRRRRGHGQGGRVLRHAPSVRRCDDAQRRLAGGSAGRMAPASDPAVAPQLGFRQRTLVGPAATRQALLQEFAACPGRPRCSSPPRTAWCGRAAIRVSSRRRGRCCARTFPVSAPCRRRISSPAPTSPTARACTG